MKLKSVYICIYSICLVESWHCYLKMIVTKMVSNSTTHESAFQGTNISHLGKRNIIFKNWLFMGYLSSQESGGCVLLKKVAISCPYHPWEWYIYLHEGLIFSCFHVGEYTGRPMDASWVWDGVPNPRTSRCQDASEKKHESLTSWCVSPPTKLIHRSLTRWLRGTFNDVNSGFRKSWGPQKKYGTHQNKRLYDVNMPSFFEGVLAFLFF